MFNVRCSLVDSLVITGTPKARLDGNVHFCGSVFYVFLILRLQYRRITGGGE